MVNFAAEDTIEAAVRLRVFAVQGDAKRTAKRVVARAMQANRDRTSRMICVGWGRLAWT